MFMLVETEKATEAPKPVPAPPADLLERGDLRVSDLTGEAIPAPLRGGRMTLGWYDWSVVALVVASLFAGIVCLVRGL